MLEALPNALGRPLGSPEVAAVRKAVAGEAQQGRSDDGTLTVYWWTQGLSLQFAKDRTLASVKFSGGKDMWAVLFEDKPQPYPGALSYGLTWNDGPDEVERKLGKPNPATDWKAGYKHLGLTLGFVPRKDGRGGQLDEVTLAKPTTPVGAGIQWPAPRPQAGEPAAFPFTLGEVKKELGRPDDEDAEFLDYHNKLNLRLSELGRLEVQGRADPLGVALVTKFFNSRLFTTQEGKAVLDLFAAKEGERTVGRFQIVDRVVLLTITPQGKR